MDGVELNDRAVAYVKEISQDRLFYAPKSCCQHAYIEGYKEGWKDGMEEGCKIDVEKLKKENETWQKINLSLIQKITKMKNNLNCKKWLEKKCLRCDFADECADWEMAD